MLQSLRIRALPLIAGICLISAAFSQPTACSAATSSCLRDGRYIMGTVLEITLCGTDSTRARRTSEKLFRTATYLDALLSTYSTDSPISRVNTAAGHKPIPVPDEVMDALSLSVHYWKLTGGTFDITVGPLMALWNNTKELPSAERLQQTLARIGSEKVALSAQGTVSLANEDMALDLGGIGKGFALDRMVRVLKEQQVEHALLDFGNSSQRALGTPPNEDGWQLLIRLPDGTSSGLITLRDQALSVSGSLGQSFTIGGHQYGHVIDPRSGQPVQRDLLACVIAPSAAQAEALSKALLILGETDGLALLERLPDVEGLLIEADKNQSETTGWERSVSFVSL